MKDSRLKKELLIIWDAFNYFKRRMVLRINYRLPIMGSRKTIEYIRKNHCSIARFGDGEFVLMSQTDNVGFQKGSTELAASLKQVLCNRSPDLLICIPRFLNSTRGCTKQAKKYWIGWKLFNQIDTVNVIRSYAGSKYRFGDSLLSRPYMDYASPHHAQIIFPLLKRLWDDRDLLIVEGEKTRLGIANDLFDNVKSIKRIIAPATNAFDHYSSILDGIVSKWNGELVLLALGPTATVLASDLAQKGIQALDIGHVDIEYEWYQMRAKGKVAIPGKYVNEVTDGKNVPSCEDPIYHSQIILTIGHLSDAKDNL